MKRPLVLLALLAGPLLAQPVLVTPPRTNLVLALDWTLPAELSGVTGYILRHGTAPGIFTEQMFVPGAVTTNAYWSNAVAGVTHYFVATTLNAEGLESDPSNVAQSAALAPRPDPPQLRQVVPLVVVIWSRPTVDDPWRERLRLGPFNALAALPTEQFRVSLEAAPATPLLDGP